MENKNTCGAERKDCAFRTTIGGQALIEGILMRGPQKQAIVVRNQEGGLEVREEELKLIKDKHPILGVPFIRGVFNFLGSLVNGVKALMWSAEFYPEEEEEEPSRFEKWLETRFGSEALMKWIIGVAVAAGIGFSILLFIILPTLATSALLYFFPDAPMWLRNLLEGVVKIAIFLIYLYLCTRMKELHRVFEYHGAEHKTIACYEARLELTVENVRKQIRFHPRCGTSFMILVLLVSIFVNAFLSWDNLALRVAGKLLLLPVVMGVSYELIMLAGRYDNSFTRAFSAPGLWMQRLTTFEPDDSMIEVAIAAVKPVLPEKPEEYTYDN